MHTLFNRIQGRLRRDGARAFCRRPVTLRPNAPLVSFTFDDFPVSALYTAGEILKTRDAVGTYYVSLGLAGKIAPTGEMFQPYDLRYLVARGHELGCHTFAHCHASETPAGVFEHSVLENRRALQRILPAVRLRTLSYPIGSPRPGTKHRCARHFSACRSGGQTYNCGEADLNLLRAFFIEQSRDNPGAILRLIDENAAKCGWLIFATHDVCAEPTRYGCTPDLFERIVDAALGSGSRIVPVSEGLEACGVNTAPSLAAA